MPKDSIYRWGIFPLWLLLTATIIFRNPVPIDETRYLSVAWEMWLRDDFLVPYLNGHTYSHKPPLLFWLFHAGWALFGVNEWWPRLVGPLCALLNLVLLRRLAGVLWPSANWTALKAPWFLAATLLWTLFATSTMFDILLTCCVLGGMLGLAEAANGNRKGWLYFTLAIGLGLLAKGPVALLHLLPTAAMVWWWRNGNALKLQVWYALLLLSLALGSLMALAWALPAANAGGDEYAGAILWHQTADRTINTKIHAHGFGWYLPLVPLCLFPWITWPRLWQRWRQADFRQDAGLKFCLTWLLATLFIFSCLPSKQIHYLIPMLPPFALICARLLADTETNPKYWPDLLPALFTLAIGLFLVLLPHVPGLAKLNWVQQVEPGWGLCVMAFGAALTVSVVYLRRLSVIAMSTTVAAAVFVGFIFFFRYTGLQYNLRPAALLLKQYADQAVPTAFVGDYQGQFNFLGRMPQPLVVIKQEQIPAWAEQHPNGFLVYLEKDQPEQAAYIQPHREHWLIFRSAAQALARTAP